MYTNALTFEVEFGLKMSIFKKILLAIVSFVAAYSIVAAIQPTDFHVERSSSISAPPEVVFSYVNDLRKWQEFSPWAKIDPSAQLAYEGPATGVGSAFSWVSTDDKVGEGRMTIVESSPNELVRFQLNFYKPFASTSTAAFVFNAEGEQTTITWSMDGHKNFIMKAIGLIMDCDKMIGSEFEKGLASLKTLAEASPHP